MENDDDCRKIQREGGRLTGRHPMRAFFTGALADAGADAGMRRRIELLPDVVFEVDANGSLMFLGGASMAMLGREPGECLHLPLSELLVPEYRSALAAILRRETALPQKLRVRVRRRDGVEAWVRVSLAPADSGGMVGTLHDISAEKSADVELADPGGRRRARDALGRDTPRERAALAADAAHRDARGLPRDRAARRTPVPVDRKRGRDQCA